MFNLEQKISEWREQMLAAGIKTPVPLEELEIHLREEIERQKHTCTDESVAFDFAVQKIGQPVLLKTEFKKVGDRTLTANRILGLLWFIYCAGSFYKLTSELSNGTTSLFTNQGVYFPDLHWNALFFLAVLMDFIYLRGLIASILLFGGVMRERRFIMFIAILDAVGGVAVMFLKPLQPLSCAFTILGFVSIWLLWPPRKPKLVSN